MKIKWDNIDKVPGRVPHTERTFNKWWWSAPQITLNLCPLICDIHKQSFSWLKPTSMDLFLLLACKDCLDFLLFHCESVQSPGPDPMCPTPTLPSKEQEVFPCPDHMYDVCFTIAFWNYFFIISFFLSPMTRNNIIRNIFFSRQCYLVHSH